MKAWAAIALLALFSVSGNASSSLPKEDQDLLQDSGGWEYLSISDVNNGFKTAHVCFDEQKGRGDCHGTIIFRPDGTFAQDITAEGKTLHRHGTYNLTDDGIVFADEFGTTDGPYSLSLDHTDSMLTLKTVQAGVTIQTRLQLERKFRKQRATSKKQSQ